MLTPNQCFTYNFSSMAMCSEECFDDCYAEPTDNTRFAATLSITCNGEHIVTVHTISSLIYLYNEA